MVRLETWDFRVAAASSTSSLRQGKVRIWSAPSEINLRLTALGRVAAVQGTFDQVVQVLED